MARKKSSKRKTIYEQSGGRFVSLPSSGKARHYLDMQTDEIVPRSFVQRTLTGERNPFEKATRRNRAENPKLSQQRPARGRRSTLPKKNKNKKSGKRRKTKTIKGKKSTLYIRSYLPHEIFEALSWLTYWRARRAKYWYANVHKSSRLECFIYRSG